MRLTQAERWILSNQYQILEALQPNDAYATHNLTNAREIVEHGYEYLYSLVSPIMDTVVTEAEGDEVVSILQMFRVLSQSYNNLPDAEKEGVNTQYTTFRGFDGNDETAQFVFARFFCLNMGNFDEFHDVEFNSHRFVLPKYRRMLALYAPAHFDDFLDREQIIEITSA